MLCLLSFSVNAKDGKPYIVFDYENNKVLEQKLENKMWAIASLTKLMTAYVFLKKENNLQSCSMAITNDDNDTLKFTKTRLEKDYAYSCESLLKMMLTVSDNYAASALARKHNKNQFIKEMNFVAKTLGMKNTIFVDSSGLSPKNVSTILDYYKLIISVKKDKKIWNLISNWSTERLWMLDSNTIKNSNKLIRDDNLKSMFSKTGYIKESGYNLIFLNKSCKSHLGIIVFGRKSSKERANFTKKLLKSYQCGV